MDFAVELADVSLSFGEVRVLRGLNLRLERGEFAALLGRSGAGKTSALAIIAGLLRPSGGRVATLGQDLAGLDEDALAAMRREQIGVVFQHFHLLETMTALENTALPLEIAGQPRALQTAAEMLDAVGLAERAGHFPAQLSGGERQRVAIARAFAPRPALLLADEPTGNLDDETGDAVLQTLFALAKEQQTSILFVTHNTAILPRFGRVWRLANGALQDA